MGMYSLVIAIFLSWSLYLTAGSSEEIDIPDEKENSNNIFKYEQLLIQRGKAKYIKASKSDSFKSRKPLLCGTFVKASNSASTALLANIMSMKYSCDWAIVIYGGSFKYEKEMCAAAFDLSKQVIHCKRATYAITSTPQHVPINTIDTVLTGSDSNAIPTEFLTVNLTRSVPKTVMYHDLLPFLPSYKKVFLLDEDVSLMGFNASEALMIWDCAFTPPPLIVQPLVYENTQYFRFVGYDTWQKKNRNVLASGVGIVEQQVPMFDSLFFDWFVRGVLSLTRHHALRHGVDWGHDRTWCNAAKMYGRDVLGWHNYLTPCGLLVGTPPIHHLDSNSISTKRKNPRAFRNHGRAVVAMYVELFPSWVLHDLTQRTNPLNRMYGSRYKKVKTLDEACVATRG